MALVRPASRRRSSDSRTACRRRSIAMPARPCGDTVAGVADTTPAGALFTRSSSRLDPGRYPAARLAMRGPAGLSATAPKFKMIWSSVLERGLVEGLRHSGLRQPQGDKARRREHRDQRARLSSITRHLPLPTRLNALHRSAGRRPVLRRLQRCSSQMRLSRHRRVGLRPAASGRRPWPGNSSAVPPPACPRAPATTPGPNSVATGRAASRRRTARPSPVVRRWRAPLVGFQRRIGPALGVQHTGDVALRDRQLALPLAVRRLCGGQLLGDGERGFELHERILQARLPAQHLAHPLVAQRQVALRLRIGRIDRCKPPADFQSLAVFGERRVQLSARFEHVAQAVAQHAELALQQSRWPGRPRPAAGQQPVPLRKRAVRRPARPDPGG